MSRIDRILFYATLSIAMLAVTVVLLMLGARVVTGCYA